MPTGGARFSSELSSGCDGNVRAAGERHRSQYTGRRLSVPPICVPSPSAWRASWGKFQGERPSLSLLAAAWGSCRRALPWPPLGGAAILPRQQSALPAVCAHLRSDSPAPRRVRGRRERPQPPCRGKSVEAPDSPPRRCSKPGKRRRRKRAEQKCKAADRPVLRPPAVERVRLGTRTDPAKSGPDVNSLAWRRRKEALAVVTPEPPAAGSASSPPAVPPIPDGELLGSKRRFFRLLLSIGADLFPSLWGHAARHTHPAGVAGGAGKAGGRRILLPAGVATGGGSPCDCKGSVSWTHPPASATCVASPGKGALLHWASQLLPSPAKR